MVQTKVKKLARISIQGIVQGVGFRPFIYRLARGYGLAGWLRNTSGSVEIEAEGADEALKAFLADLKVKAPPMAHIEKVEATFHGGKGYTDFIILESTVHETEYQLVSPDIATCTDCRREIFSPADRRFRYPFTNCTNCGPRFTIIKDIPYDRPRTTMSYFKMCPNCQREYGNPLDRRFHAQPNACPVCGPKLELLEAIGKPVQCEDVIKKTTELLKAGKIVAIKGLGGFQLACDATSETAVNQLRTRKRRHAKPFAIMLGNIEEVKKHCYVSPEEQRLLESAASPIVLLKWLQDKSSICPAVAPGLKYMGVMLSYTPLHHLLLKEVGVPLIMTSGNLSEEPIACDNEEALRRLNGIADYFLVHNRDIYSRYDDSVYLVEGNEPRAVRRARGYAPYPIILPFKTKQILACGAQEKTTFCMTRDEHAFLSQHIGDLENEETLEHFTNTIELYKKLFRIKPEAVAYDMHPEYLSTRYALAEAAANGLPLTSIQHHHAHIASCMAENGVAKPVIGVAFDGTGYGTDGTIWGGEFLLADYKGFRRLAHFENIPMPGGEAAIKKPYRMALGYLYTLLGEDFSLEGMPLAKIRGDELEIIQQQIKRNLNSPLTSSAGRLFDAVAALLDVRQEIQYDAQAAIELEMLATDVDCTGLEPYPFIIAEENGVRVIKLGELLKAIIDELRKGTPPAQIATRFHVTVADVITAVCRDIARETGINRVVLSGGVFQNRLLFGLVTQALEKGNFRVITHRLVPCNDGGIALGQAVIANFKGDV